MLCPLICGKLYAEEPPYAGKSDSQILFSILKDERLPKQEVISEGWRDIVKRCRAQTPEERPTAVELVRDIENIIGRGSLWSFFE